MLNFVKRLCSLGFKKLPNINEETYVYNQGPYKMEYQFKVDVAEKRDNDDVYVYGWCVQTNFNFDKNNRWVEHWNHKIYSSKDIALDAINQFEKQVMVSNSKRWSYRAIPLYSFHNNGWRTHLINKIIEEK